MRSPERNAQLDDRGGMGKAGRGWGGESAVWVRVSAGVASLFNQSAW